MHYKKNIYFFLSIFANKLFIYPTDTKLLNSIVLFYHVFLSSNWHYKQDILLVARFLLFDMLIFNNNYVVIG